MVFPKETIAFTDKPVNSLQIFRISSLNVKGTKAGNVGITFKSNFLATSYPNLLAPIFGIERPPVATTSDLQEKASKYREEMIETVVELDEAAMEKYLDGEELDI